MNEISNDVTTPKTAKLVALVTSTVDRTKSQKQRDLVDTSLPFESSLGILSLNNVDISNIVDVSTSRKSVDQVLQQQRQLANDTLNRASRVAAIPSRFFQPDLQQTKSDDNFHVACESTINESDLLQTPKNTSTPRNSSVDLDLLKMPPPTAPRESIFSRFRDMLDTDMSTQHAVEEFKQISQANKSTQDSMSFIPAEEAGSKLLADELSWKRKNDMPVAPNFTSFQETKDLPSMSIGEFFQQGCDNISELRAKSPIKADPVPLIDSTLESNVSKNMSSARNSSIYEARSRSSISAIQHLLSETNNTPNKVIDYLSDYLLQQQNRKTSKKVEAQGNSSEVFSLPVSRDESYTSLYSDNEAVRVAVSENKENIQPPSKNKYASEHAIINQLPVSSDQKSLSPCLRSSSALTNIPDGKLPIEATMSELAWGCVKVDRCVTKQFVLRNRTAKTVGLQCSVSTYDFKIRKDNRSDSDLSTHKFVLHGNESKPLIVSFIPTKIGPAIDKLIFSPLDANLRQTKQQCVRLWGYGGYINNEYQGASRDNTGKYWMSLGRMDNRLVMDQQFTVKNTGNLPSFTYIKVIPKSLVNFTNLKIEPQLFILLPNEEKPVKVTYTPNAKDFRLLKHNVLPVVDIGKLEIVSGPEVTRQRLRRLNRKSIEKGLPVNKQTQILSGSIPGEIHLTDTVGFKECPGAIPDILETLKNEEMVVTIEQDPDQTLLPDYLDLEDSVSYQSLCCQTTMVDESVLSRKSFRLEPPLIVLCYPKKLEDCLFLTSDAAKTVSYKVSCIPNGLRISPLEGAICPGETVEFNVKLLKNVTNSYFKVKLCLENEEFVSEVKVLNARSTSSTNDFLE